MSHGDRDFIGALGKGLAVIEAFDASNPRMTLSEVARRTGLTRPTARRYLLSLLRLNYAESDGKGFRLSYRVLRLGHAYLASAQLPRVVQPLLDRIAADTREAASLSALEGSEIIFLASSVAPRMMAATINVGLRLPAYSTASGRVLLAGLADKEVEARLKELARRRLTAKTRTGLDELQREVARARAAGYAISDEEQEIGLRSIAVPLALPRTQARFALTVSVHAGRLGVADLERRVLPKLRAARQRLELLL